MSINTEWFQGRGTDEEKMERCYWRRVGLAIFLGIALAVILLPLVAVAKPQYLASSGDVTITLFNDKCELKEVANLPFKVTWQEGGKVFHGCFGVNGEAGVVMMFFPGDKSVAAAPVGMFKPVTGV